MRVLLVHNRYRSALPSGESRVVDDEADLLRGAGVDVDVFQRDSDDIEHLGTGCKALLAASAVRSSASVRALRTRIAAHRPDVLHLHNPFPLISPWVVRTAHEAGVPVVQTVHNYRHSCLAGTLYRDGAPCSSCLGRVTPWPSVVHGCYRGSRVQSMPMAVAQVVHRPTWRMVTRFLAVSGFVADHLVRTGVPRVRVVVKPNPVLDQGRAATEHGSGYFFAGRLDPEKGALDLLDAWQAAGLRGERLTIAGDGPLRDAVAARAAGLPGVRFVGRLPRQEVNQLLDEHAVAVVPSLWHETFGLLVVEAFARGRPALVTRMGGLSELVDDAVGWVAEPDHAGLAGALAQAAQVSPEGLTMKGQVARARYEAGFTPQRASAALLDVYRAVLAETAG